MRDAPHSQLCKDKVNAVSVYSVITKTSPVYSVFRNELFSMGIKLLQSPRAKEPREFFEARKLAPNFSK